MATRGSMIGRAEERAVLAEKLDLARGGEGSLVLIAGEAGVGKTRLIEEFTTQASAAVLWGAGSNETTPAYGPLVMALRSHLRANPDALDDCGPLEDHLRVLLPELGEAPETTDPATLREAIRCALVSIAREREAVLVLDDLQWADAATIELLTTLGPSLAGVEIVVLGAYRSDELSREHPLRRMRNALRRTHALSEIQLGAFDEDGTAQLVEATLGERPSRPLAKLIHERSQGLPFFAEELASALASEERIRKGSAGLELAEGSDVCVPETIRDAVLLRCSDLSAEGREAADVAAVAGERFPIELVVGLSGEEGLDELIRVGLVEESGEGAASFRHALVREALYRDVPWLRRRALHRSLAERLEGAPAVEVAIHWEGARDDERARVELLRAAEEFESGAAALVPCTIS